MMPILSFTNQTLKKNNRLYKWITDYTNEERASKVTLYFGETLSEHIDPILPVPSSNLDDDIEITAFVPGNDVFPGIHIKQEDDTVNDDSVVIVEELSSSVSYTRMGVKSEDGKFIWLLLFSSEKFLFYLNFHKSIRSTTVNLKII